MKFNRLLFAFIALLACSTVAFAQDDAAEEQPDGWTRGAGLGLDLGQLLQVNPRVGSGENRIGIGGNASMFAKLKKGRLSWDNTASLQLAVQRLGSGLVAQGSEQTIPFQKSIDELRLQSTAGYSFAQDSPWGYGLEAVFITQLLPTYQDSFERNILKDIDGTNGGTPIADFLSPGTFTISPGITYRPNENFNALISPASFKSVFVANEDIRALALYDYLDADNDGKRVLNQFGATISANYTNKFLEDERLIFSSKLILFSNYLNNPQNIDIDWRNEIGYEIIKGLTITLNTTLLYDDDIPVQITNYDVVGGVERNGDGTLKLGPRPTFIEQILVKYAVVF